MKISGTLMTALAVVIVVLSGCDDGNSDTIVKGATSGNVAVCPSCADTAEGGPEVVIPSYPYRENDVINVDVNLIMESASEYCNEKGDAANAPEFYMGYLPLWSADRLCGKSMDTKALASLLGNIYISGYFGGLWLRDALAGEDEAINEAINTMQHFVHLASGTGTGCNGSQAIFSLLTSVVRFNVDMAVTGDDLAAFVIDRFSLDPFLMLYGYNWGYFMYILDNPPEGMEAPPGYDKVCPRFMDCDMPGVALDTLEKYKPVLNSLYAPDTVRWEEVNLLMHLWGEGAVAIGENVWGMIMAASSMSQPATYELLLELSGRFMMMAELSLLPAMKGFAEGDEEAGRCGILQEAGMIVWAASYFMGLGSDQQSGVFPEL